MLDEIKAFLDLDAITLTDEEVTRLLTLLTNRVVLYLFGSRKKEIPESLYPVIAEMFQEQYTLENDEMNGVHTVKDGQQSVSYRNLNTRFLSAHDVTLFASHTAVLNRFRVLELVV